jgi:hypothetical protein
MTSSDVEWEFLVNELIQAMTLERICRRRVGILKVSSRIR